MFSGKSFSTEGDPSQTYFQSHVVPSDETLEPKDGNVRNYRLPVDSRKIVNNDLFNGEYENNAYNNVQEEEEDLYDEENDGGTRSNHDNDEEDDKDEEGDNDREAGNRETVNEREQLAEDHFHNENCCRKCTYSLIFC